MKTTKSLICVVLLCLGTSMGFAQNKLDKAPMVTNRISKSFSPVVLNKIREKDFEKKAISDFRAIATKDMKVPSSFLDKPAKQSWKITPSRAFGSGNLGLSIYSGQLRRQFFVILGDFVGSRAIKYNAHLSFDARKGKMYLIKITTGGPSGTSYLYAYAGVEMKVTNQNGYYPILFEARESGKMMIALSARHKNGGNERYPDPLSIKEITIAEL